MGGIACMVCLLVCVLVYALINEKEGTTNEEDKKRKALEALRYEGHKEYEFWSYVAKRKKGKLTYIVPEFEKRIVKMNELKEREDW